MRRILVATLLVMTAVGNLSFKLFERKDVKCKPYFQFDKIDHFHINVDEKYMSDLAEKDGKSEKEKQMVDWVRDFPENPRSLADTIILDHLGEFGYIKKDINRLHFQLINSVFCDNGKRDDIKVHLCIPVYRDILVFKKSSQIVGFAKLCFDCKQSIIVGTHRDTVQFGQNDEFEKLQPLLNLN
jgi:hypothetical protein